MWKRILWERTGGYYMFYTGLAYLLVGMYNIFVEHFVSAEVAQVIWLATLAFPFICPPFGRWLNMDITWDQKMFNFFRGKTANEYIEAAKDASNVYNLPKLVPEVQPPKEPEKPATTYYRLGLTSDNRVSFQMGYSEITMNSQGVENMIAQLEVFLDQVREHEGTQDESN